MAKVLGVGGVFFKAADMEGLKAWYGRVLGLEFTDWGGVFFPPLPTGGTVWSPFAADSDHFKPSDAPFMVNFVVDDLPALLARVRAEGVEVSGETEMAGMGRFASVMDPNGVKVELWEPEAPAAADTLDVSPA